MTTTHAVGRREAGWLGSGAPLLERLLERVAQGAVREGRLDVVSPSGRVIRAGTGAQRPLRIAVHDWATVLRLGLFPHMALGEAYMDGGLTVEVGDLPAFLDLIGANLALKDEEAGPIPRLLGALAEANGRIAARRHVAHYELPVDFYRRFLDEDLQYSCAVFERPGQSLEAAQSAKKRRIAGKLLLRPGLKVLDIGCGWGGLALSLAEDYGAIVRGVSLAQSQIAHARTRAEARGLSGAVTFALEDYRDLRETYDRIVSVGMFEHVGRPNYDAYFQTIARALADDGVAVVHSIGRTRPSGGVQPWIGRYIFPGGYIPALSQVLPAVERAGLWVTDVEVLRLHYAETLRHWRSRYLAQIEAVAAERGQRFARTWDFYLAVSEMAFRRRGCMVFQLQLAKRPDAAPLTRDYLTARLQSE